MASPQLEDGFVRIANEIYDALCKARIPGEARQVLDVIIRKTYGWNKKLDRISLTQFEVNTGMPRRSVCRAILKLINMNMISVEKDTRKITTYEFQKDYKKWKVVSKLTPSVKKDTTLVSKVTLRPSVEKDTYNRQDNKQKTMQPVQLEKTEPQTTLTKKQQWDVAASSQLRSTQKVRPWAPDEKPGDYKKAFQQAKLKVARQLTTAKASDHRLPDKPVSQEVVKEAEEQLERIRQKRVDKQREHAVVSKTDKPMPF